MRVRLITENQLDDWVRGNSAAAQGTIVELVARLVAASCPRPKERRFPLGDSIGQHGPDGVLDVEADFEPFVPDGYSIWEIGTGERARDKATEDYRDRTEATPEATRTRATFVFVTPHSARRDWEYTWKKEGQCAWVEERRGRGEWRDVRVLDGTKLIEWINRFLPVGLWLVEQMGGIRRTQIETPEQHWAVIASYGAPPPLSPQVFLVDRDDACAQLNEVLAGTVARLKLNTRFPMQVVDFVAAHIAALPEEARVEAAGRCLFVSGMEEWKALAGSNPGYVLVADPSLDLTGDVGTALIQKARNAGHSVIFGGPRGGIPDPTSIPLREPRPERLQEALEKGGYREERARTLAQRAAGNLGSLLRFILNLSVMPEWAESSAAAELAIAQVLGSWDEKLSGDQEVTAGLSGKAYGEWIAKIHEAAASPATPLAQRGGVWRFVARYEGWHALGPRLYDNHLGRLRWAVETVLAEPDPSLSLPVAERYLASIKGKTRSYSPQLRKGLAECLALLGSSPGALASCTPGTAEGIAFAVVRSLLHGADWVRWASLADVLPLLAEAAPGEFLDAVDTTLASSPCPFDELFAQEGGTQTGHTYIAGLLWALETLAWDAELLTRVVSCLGRLAARDPGGAWANRPAGSLATILLPWMPQTCAPVQTRAAAVSIVLSESPSAGWKLVLGLLPTTQSVSHGTCRPVWRNTIPEDWKRGVALSEYWEQVNHYADLAVAHVTAHPELAADLIDHLGSLPPAPQGVFLDYLGSVTVVRKPELERLALWSKLTDLISKHRKFPEAAWAMSAEQVARVSTVAELLAPVTPFFRYQRLFTDNDFHLLEERGRGRDQRIELEARRNAAIGEIAAGGGIESVLGFAGAVESPWRAGLGFGEIAGREADSALLPQVLGSEKLAMSSFIGGFVLGRFRSFGWHWVDGLDTSAWELSQLAQFLTLLPFSPETWRRSAGLLGDNQRLYWEGANVRPYDTDEGLEVAIDALVANGRPFAAIRCLTALLDAGRPLESRQAAQALLAAVKGPEGAETMDRYDVVEIIKRLQSDPGASPDDVIRVEWAYLRLLDSDQDASPTLLERRLQEEPGFFCELIRLAFHPRTQREVETEPATDDTKNIAGNAYRLLSAWQNPPGQRPDGTLDGEVLESWVEAVKAECTESGHLGTAMTMVGHVLAHTTEDPGGLWIHGAAAKVLDAPDAEDMRTGFHVELVNARGAHWVDPSGKPELELAEGYRNKAKALNAAGFFRLGGTLLKIAGEYEHEAERVQAREAFDD